MHNDTMFAWAQQMLNVIQQHAPNINGGLGGMSSPEGEELPKEIGDKILAQFHSEGYRVSNEDGNFVVSSKESNKYGVTFDYTDEWNDDPKTCYVFFFNEDFN